MATEAEASESLQPDAKRIQPEVSESLQPAAQRVQSESSVAPGKEHPQRTPAASPERDEDLAEGLMISDLDPQEVTLQIIEVFCEGYHEEALAAAVEFAGAAGQELGRTHPTYIGALATVAAIAEQMGRSDVAAALLDEAENLHEELEMDELERELEDKLGPLEPTSGEEPEGAAGGAENKKATTLVTEGKDGGAVAEDGHGNAFFTAVDKEQDERDPSSSGSDGDAEDEATDTEEGDSSESDSDEDSEQTAAQAEAEAITRLTWEVNGLVKEGNVDLAARLLSEAEQVLVGDGSDIGELSSMTRAALHSLWALVLETIGEADKAQHFYDEALECLGEQVQRMADACEDEEDEEDEEEEEEEEDDGDGETEDPPSQDEAPLAGDAPDAEAPVAGHII